MAHRRIRAVGLSVLVLVAVGCRPGADFQFTAEREGPLSLQQPCPDAPEPNAGLAGIDRGTWARVTESVDGVDEEVLRFDEAGRLRVLAADAAARYDEYSVIILFRLSALEGRRVPFFAFDDPDDSSNSGSGLFLDDGRLAFPEAGLVGTTAIADDEWVQVAVTRARTGEVRAYLDGVEQWSFTDSGGLTRFSSFLHAFNRAGGAGSAGAVARLRLYPWPLKPEAVAGADQTPATPC